MPLILPYRPTDLLTFSERSLAIVSEKTGYPPDMLDLELDVEADLGIDTVKQAEVFAAIREAYDIPRREDLKLRDYNTLSKVVGFVHEARPDLIAAPTAPESTAPAPTAAVAAAPSPPPEGGNASASEETMHPILND